HANVTSLVAPAFADDGRIEGHAEEPRAVFADRRVPQAIAADDPLGELGIGFLPAVAAIVEFLVGGEVGEEFLRRNMPGFAELVAKVREIGFAEGVSLVVLDVPRHIDSQEHGRAVVHRVDPVARYEVPLAGWKDEMLRPDAAGFFARSCGLVFE